MSLSKDLIMITQNFIHSRRLLSLDPSAPANLPGVSSTEPYSGGGTNSFDANVVMVLSVLLCALICSLGLNSIVRCALRCSTLVSAASPETASSHGGGGGNGIKKKALKTFPTVSFGSAEHLSLPGLDGECAICLSEFVAGDKLRLLPKCYHGFHVRCIDKWLNSHSSCPKCRHNLLDTCQKIVGGGATTSSENNCPATTLPPPPPLPPAVVVVDISPLEHEGPERNYRGDSC